MGLVLGLPVSGLFTWLAIRNADLATVWRALGEARWPLVLTAVAALSILYAGQALRWREIVRAPGVPSRRFAEMVVSAVAVNNVLPGRVGDVLRARWLQLAGPLPAGRALASVFIDRAFDVLALVVFLAVSVPFMASEEWVLRVSISAGLLLVVLALAVLGARVYTRTRARERRQRTLVRRIARDALEGLADPLGRTRSVALAALSVASWSIWALAAWLVARAVGVELSPLEAIFVTAVVNLGVAIPSSPGFIGTYQWLGVSSLALLGVGTDRALAFAILMHATWYVPTLVVGGGLLLRRGVRAVKVRSLVHVPSSAPPG
ncbi:MAG TPA: lysylphosphatidylglycerol synthase transmembrane domain-containing protein [Gaiellaceae bacterium]|nr:lysylphosphatidylglycerol synthase transmembrane domain-containing protein [Gaiellaceae bacterium]